MSEIVDAEEAGGDLRRGGFVVRRRGRRARPSRSRAVAFAGSLAAAIALCLSGLLLTPLDDANGGRRAPGRRDSYEDPSSSTMMATVVERWPPPPSPSFPRRRFPPRIVDFSAGSDDDDGGQRPDRIAAAAAAARLSAAATDVDVPPSTDDPTDDGGSASSTETPALPSRRNEPKGCDYVPAPKPNCNDLHVIDLKHVLKASRLQTLSRGGTRDVFAYLEPAPPNAPPDDVASGGDDDDDAVPRNDEGGDDGAGMAIRVEEWDSKTRMRKAPKDAKETKKKKKKKKRRDVKVKNEYIGRWQLKTGRWRDAEEILVVKTLRWIRDFTPDLYDLQSVENVILDATTPSNHTLDVYVHCGLSSVSDLAQGGNLYDVLRAVGPKHKVGPKSLLFLARESAKALADLQEKNWGGKDVEGGLQIVHRDIGPSNVLFKGGNVIIDDFNKAHLIRRNPIRGGAGGGQGEDDGLDGAKEVCSYREGFVCGEDGRRTDTRSPEECHGNVTLTPRIDTYGLGTVLFFLLTGQRTYYYEPDAPQPSGDFPDWYRDKVVRGVNPTLPSKIEGKNDPAIAAVKNAMRRCMSYDPVDRPSPSRIAEELNVVASEIMESIMKERLGGG